MVQNKAFMYKSVPDGFPIAGKDLAIESSDFDLAQPAPEGGIITKNFYASYDPSQRGRMRDPSLKSYSPAMQIDKPVTSVMVIGKVLASDHAEIKKGQMILVWAIGTEEYSVITKQQLQGKWQIIEKKEGVPLSAYLGALGMSGLTAFGSLKEIGQPKEGETIFISAAAGSVGQTVGQIAVRQGLKVIGSVGDDRKLEYITKELGFSGGFNYKKESTNEALKRLAPNGVDIYFDNVGGETLDAALAHMNDFGRISKSSPCFYCSLLIVTDKPPVACGAISQYNNKPGEEPYGVKNYAAMVRKRLTWRGFIVTDPPIYQHVRERDESMSKWIAEGSFKVEEYVTDGMDNAIDGFLGMLQGKNLGKSVLKIAEPEW